MNCSLLCPPTLPHYHSRAGIRFGTPMVRLRNVRLAASATGRARLPFPKQRLPAALYPVIRLYTVTYSITDNTAFARGNASKKASISADPTWLIYHNDDTRSIENVLHKCKSVFYTKASVFVRGILRLENRDHGWYIIDTRKNTQSSKYFSKKVF